MTDNDDSLPGVGHNMPPAFDAGVLADMEAQVRAIAETAGQWLDVGEIETEGDASRLADFLTALGDTAKAVDAARREAKAPHDAAIAEVQSAFGPLALALDAAKGRLKGLLIAYTARAEAARAEERNRAIAQAQGRLEEARGLHARAEAANDVLGMAAAANGIEAAEAALKAAGGVVKVRIASATGAGRTMGVRTTRRVQITNINLAFRHYRDHPDVAATIERLATAEIRGAKGADVAIPGITIAEERSVA